MFTTWSFPRSPGLRQAPFSSPQPRSVLCASEEEPCESFRARGPDGKGHPVAPRLVRSPARRTEQTEVIPKPDEVLMKCRVAEDALSLDELIDMHRTPATNRCIACIAVDQDPIPESRSPMNIRFQPGRVPNEEFVPGQVSNPRGRHGTSRHM